MASIVLFFIFDIFNFERVLDGALSGVYILLTGLLVSELYTWIKRGKRGDSTDIIVLVFLFVAVFVLTRDPLNSFVGAFSIYLIFGIMELKDYEVLNKILIITVVTYNFIFFAGLINSYMISIGAINTNVIRDTAFSLSIWIMLILGFALFGRKYIIVFRFISPQYLSLFLFILAWLFIRFISKWWSSATQFIYLLLILSNWLVYLATGPIIDVMLGIKRTDNELILNIVEEVKKKIGITKNVKVGFGNYPILNAMAYGAWFDKRIAIIAPDINSIPIDELKGIIAHELNHTKGGFSLPIRTKNNLKVRIPDTLMLSIISTIEIGIFWILKWPATIYDYMFNPENQPFPLWVFFMINILVSVILYIFVRVLEGYADLNTKLVGYSNELAKGLYNLEGFYSSSREIGLDTMLLCDEKITEYNKITNYATTAEYLSDNMHYPSRLTLLSNLLNSHPPTYHRIISMYSNDNNQLNPWRESLLPFSLLSSKRRILFSLEYENARKEFFKMSNQKFKTMFGIKDYSEYLDRLNKKELYQVSIGKVYYYFDRMNWDLGIGILKDIKLNDDINNPYSYVIIPINYNLPAKVIEKLNLKNNKLKNIDKETLEEINLLNKMFEKVEIQKKIVNTNNAEKLFNPLYCNLYELNFNKRYILKNKAILILIGMVIPDLSNEKKVLNPNKDFRDKHQKQYYIKHYKKIIKKIKKESYFIYLTSDSKILSQQFAKKIGFSLDIIERSQGKNIFLEEKGTLRILKLKEFQLYNDINQSKLICEDDDISNNDLEFKLSRTIIMNQDISFIFHNDESTAHYEEKLLEYLKNNKIRTTFYLKKPVNNQETGYIINYSIDKEDRKNNSTLNITTIQKNNLIIPFNKIEIIVFAEDTITIVNKDTMSLGEKINKKVSRWRKPYKIFNP